MIEPNAVCRVAVIGAGTIGSSWAAHFLGRGMHVTVSDPGPGASEKLKQFIEDAWPAVQRLGGLDDADPSNWRFCHDSTEAVGDAQFVQESGPERLDEKIAIYKAVEPAMGDDVVLATSTSGLLISQLQADCRRPGRFVVGHPVNPPHIIPLVEVVAGTRTDPQVTDWAMAFYKFLGKHPVHIRKEVPGHLLNRLQVALLREAIHAVDADIASVADVDATLTAGLGLRWALMGAHLTFHLAGGPGGARHQFEHLGPAVEQWWADLGDPHLTPDVCAKVVEGIDRAVAHTNFDQLVAKRDEMLVALLEMIGEQGGHPGDPAQSVSS